MMSGYCTVSDDGRVTWRASALGACRAALVWARRGVTPQPPPDDMERRFRDGHLHEGAVLADLARTLDVRDAGREVLLPITSMVCVRGRVDAIAVAGQSPCETVDAPFIIEVKALADSGWRQWEAGGLRMFPRYEWQISVYMLALGLPAVFCVKNKNSGVMLYEAVREPPRSLAEIVQRIMEVEGLAVRTEMRPSCDEPLDFPCPYWLMHERKERKKRKEEKGEASSTETTGALVGLVSAYVRARDEESRWRAEKDAAREKLLAYKDGQPWSATVAGWSVEVTKRARKSFSVQRLTDQHPDLVLDGCWVESEHDVLTVREVGEG